MKNKYELFFAIALFLAVCSYQVQAQLTTVFNSSIGHVYTEPVSGVLIDHELMFNYAFSGITEDVIVSDFAVGFSFKYSYFPTSGKTTSSLMANANITYTPAFLSQSLPIAPYFGASYSYVEMLEYNDNGTGFTGLVGVLFPINESAAFFIQLRMYDFSTKANLSNSDIKKTNLGNTMIQTGFSYLLQ
jgi:hypothetical protein